MTSLNLPPLPPVGGETTGRNVIDVLNEQHRELLALCERLTAATDTTTDDATATDTTTADMTAAGKERVAQVVVATLSRHLSAEEQYLYPAVRKVVPDGDLLADRELAEDHGLLVTLKRLDGVKPDDPSFEALAGDVAAAVRRHVDADAEELLPLLAQMVPVEDLIRVGNRVETAEEAAPTRPHPATPSRPPWNKIVDPAVAVLDKVRDVAARRVTYPRDL